jgi:spore maturation protein CgeB
VIVLRGLSIYKTKPYQCNILWIISHPDLVAIAECESYNLVFTASEKHKAYLNAQGIAAETLLQCTDQNLFSIKTDGDREVSGHAIFVGNTRNVYRPIIKHAIENDIDFQVVGAGWRDFIPASYVIADYAPNDSLPDLYGSAKFVLNDHWQSMKVWGFISNRVFDVVACGAPCLSDYVEGIEQIFGGAVVTYDDKTDFSDAVNRASRLRKNEPLLAETSARVVREHTFQRRAEQILGRFNEWEKGVLSSKTYDGVGEAKSGTTRCQGANSEQWLKG